jgi:hypothetical protein
MNLVEGFPGTTRPCPTLTDAQIMGLEKARQGKDLELHSDLTAVQLGAVDGWPAREYQLTVRISTTPGAGPTS